MFELFNYETNACIYIKLIYQGFLIMQENKEDLCKDWIYENKTFLKCQGTPQ